MTDPRSDSRDAAPGRVDPMPPAASSERPQFPGPSSPIPGMLHPPGWPRGSGYAHGIAAEGRQIFIAGQIGCDPVTNRMVGQSIEAQTRQALTNIVAVLAEAGAGPQHLVRLTWFIKDRDLYVRERKTIGAAYREVIGNHFPPMSIIIVSGLLERAADVEIEATAVVPFTDRTTTSAGADRRTP